MSLSVIVTSYESPLVLERCLESLTRQPAAQRIVVVDCSAVDPAIVLGQKFPSVEFVHRAERTQVPAMRWSVLDRLTTDVIAAVEGRCVPAADWCATLAKAHEENPASPAIGGGIAPPDSKKAWEMALFFTEYGYFASPVSPGPARELSGANLSYKRDQLLAEQDLLTQGRWETLLHLRWLERGKTFVLAPAEVRFENTMRLGAFVRQRFAYGRGYASDRTEGRNLAHRSMRAATCLALPALLAFRIGRAAFRKGLGRLFLKALGWVMFFVTAWSAGELVGYLFGKARGQAIY